MATRRRYRGGDLVNPDGRNFVEFQGAPLPENTEDMRKWASALLAVLDTNFAQIEKSISGTGEDLRQIAERIDTLHP